MLLLVEEELVLPLLDELLEELLPPLEELPLLLEELPPLEEVIEPEELPLVVEEPEEELEELLLFMFWKAIRRYRAGSQRLIAAEVSLPIRLRIARERVAWPMRSRPACI